MIYWNVIDIKDNVFIGSGSIILPDVTIGSNAIVAARAVVSSAYSEGTIVGGVPAKVIGEFNRIYEKRRLGAVSEVSKMNRKNLIKTVWELHDLDWGVCENEKNNDFGSEYFTASCH